MSTRLARTDTFEHTISGLLRRRADLFGEAERLRDRMAEIKNDIHAIDRVLQSWGYARDLDAAMPRQKRDVIFGRGELTRAILSELRDSDRPLSSREIARSIVALRGDDESLHWQQKNLLHRSLTPAFLFSKCSRHHG